MIEFAVPAPLSKTVDVLGCDTLLQSTSDMNCGQLYRPVSRLRCMPFSRVQVASGRNVTARSQGAERAVKVAHILLQSEQNSLAGEIEEKLVAGAPFEDLARQHSTCGSAKKGGDLGWLSPGTFFPQFEAAALSTPVGGISRAVTGRGLHLIKVLAERYQSVVQQMPPEELAEMLGSPAALEDVQLVDVREEWEWQTARLPGFRLMPLSQFNTWGSEVSTRLDPTRETVVMCHHGVRSMQMAQFLVQNGFSDVKNVTGGIDNYSKVDPSVPIY